MLNNEFIRLKDFIWSECGIKITDAKRTMLEARLQKRVRKLNLPSISQYCEYLFTPKGMEEELKNMIDQVTTNKTDFFREPTHFRYLEETALPEVAGRTETVVVWSAGCSSGEEVYTLAMVLKESGAKFVIHGTDISTRVLEKARLAVYTEEEIAPIPGPLKKKYLLASKDRTKGLYRIAPSLREQAQFRRLNFMDSEFGFRTPVDVIFCRNVIIYFDKPTQEKLLRKFARYLAPHGYLFVGHSETILGMNVPFTPVAPTIYRKSGFGR